MQRAVGVICLIIGVLLIVKGHDVANSVASQLKQVFVGAPLNQAMKLYLSGVGLGLAGLFLIFWNGK
jgi:hypothetical protein